MKRRLPGYLYCLTLVLGSWGCVQGSTGTSSSDLDAHGAAEVHTDATLQPGSKVPPSECVVTEALAVDPLVSAGSTEPNSDGQKHLTDIDYDPESGLIVGSGMPGLALMRATEGAPENLASVKKGKDHVEILSADVVAVSSRGKSGKDGNALKGAGVGFLNISNPAQPKQISIAGAGSYLPISGASGMEYREPYLYVGTHDGKFVTIDAGNPSEATVVSEVEGLGSPWQMVIHEDWAYVADNSKGIVSVDLSDPTAPVIASSVSLGGGVQDVDVSDGVLYAAAGSAGLFALSLDDPSAPVVLGTASTGGAAISVSVDGGYAWVTNQESVLVYDVNQPANPIPLGVEDTPSWAMHVVADGHRAFVADWKEVTTFVYTAGSMAPDADVELSSIYFTGGDETRVFRVTNRGGADLVVHGLGTADPRFSVEVDTLTVAPGEAMQVTLNFTSDGAEVSDTLCLSTNDPDEPLQEIELASTSSGSNILIGEAAPDFILAGLDGANYTLSSMKGKPIVLCFFASW
jgi:hypothetical protein